MKLKLKLKKKPNSGPQEETKSSCVSIPERRSAVLTRADMIIRKKFRKPVEDSSPSSDPQTCLLQLPQYILNFDPKLFKKRKHSQDSDSEQLQDQNIPPRKQQRQNKDEKTSIKAEIKHENEPTRQQQQQQQQNLKQDIQIKKEYEKEKEQPCQQQQQLQQQKDVHRSNQINKNTNDRTNINNNNSQKINNNNNHKNMDDDFNHESPQGPLESKQTVETSVLTDTKYTQTTSFENKNQKNQSNQFNQQVGIQKVESHDFQMQTLPVLTFEKGVQTLKQKQEEQKSRKIDQNSQEFKILLEKACEDRLQEYISRQRKLEDELAQKQKTITRLQKLRQCAKLRQADLNKDANMKFLQDQARSELDAWKEQFQLDWIMYPQEHARDEKRRTDEMLKQSGIHDKSIIQGLTATIMFLSLAKGKNSQMVVKQTGDMLYSWYVDARTVNNYNNIRNQNGGHSKSGQTHKNVDPQNSDQRIALIRLMIERVTLMCYSWWLHHEGHDRIFKEEGANANLNQGNNHNLNNGVNNNNNNQSNNFRNGNSNQRQSINVDAFVLQRRESFLQKFKRNSESFRQQVDRGEQDWGVLYLMNIFCQHLGAQCMHITVSELAWRVDQLRQGLIFVSENNWEQPGGQQRQVQGQGQGQGELDNELDGNAVLNGMR